MASKKADAIATVARLWRGGERLKALQAADDASLKAEERPDGMAEFEATVRSH